MFGRLVKLEFESETRIYSETHHLNAVAQDLRFTTILYDGTSIIHVSHGERERCGDIPSNSVTWSLLESRAFLRCVRVS